MGWSRQSIKAGRRLEMTHSGHELGPARRLILTNSDITFGAARNGPARCSVLVLLLGWPYLQFDAGWSNSIARRLHALESSMFQRRLISASAVECRSALCRGRRRTVF